MAWGLSRISSREISEWKAFARIEPMPEERADFRAAQIMALLAEINRNTEVHKEPFSPEEFVPQWGQTSRKAKSGKKKKTAGALPAKPGARQPQPARSWESMLEQVKIMNAAFGGKEIKKDEHAGDLDSQASG